MDRRHPIAQVDIATSETVWTFTDHLGTPLLEVPRVYHRENERIFEKDRTEDPAPSGPGRSGPW